MTVTVRVCGLQPCSAVSLSEFDSTVAALESFALSLESQSLQEEATNEHLSADDLEFLEIEAELGVDAQAQTEENPSYTLAYPPASFASQAAGGFFHPYSNVNPLTAPWQGFAPVAGPAQVVSAAAIAASPATYYASALQPLAAVAPMHPALTNTFPVGDAKGGYNAHGLLAAHNGLYHQGLSADLTSLGGKAAGGGGEGGEEGGEEEGESFLEHSASGALSQHNDPAEMEAAAEEVAYGLFPAPPAHSAAHFIRDNMAALGPHKLQFAGIGDNEVDSDFAFVETAAATEADAADACINCSFA